MTKQRRVFTGKETRQGSDNYPLTREVPWMSYIVWAQIVKRQQPATGV